MHPLVAPPVWGPHVPVAIDHLSAAAPECLVLRAETRALAAAACADALHLGTLVIMGDEAGAVGVFDIEEGLVTADAVEARGRDEGREKSGEGGESGCVGGRKTGEGV